jgi:uncharacterized protein (TIGR00369 family)
VSKILNTVQMAQPPDGLPEDAQEIAIPGFNRFVGPVYRLADSEDGALRRYAFRIEEKHMNAAGTVHGGMLMTVADIAMAQTSRQDSGATRGNTVSLNCDFVGPGRLGEIVEARVRVTRRARTMVFLSAELFAQDRLLLVASGLWKLNDPA